MSDSSKQRIPPPRLSRVTHWTQERIESLSTPEVRQLKVNADRLAEPEVAALCIAILAARPRAKRPKA
ncbi:MAG TPA: hypothetical protein VFV84_04655 [Burkholderiales bacterium]|nr:hypothetical protein [Burkholderiales bacterium]